MTSLLEVITSQGCTGDWTVQVSDGAQQESQRAQVQLNSMFNHLTTDSSINCKLLFKKSPSPPKAPIPQHPDIVSSLSSKELKIFPGQGRLVSSQYTHTRTHRHTRGTQEHDGAVTHMRSHAITFVSCGSLRSASAGQEMGRRSVSSLAALTLQPALLPLGKTPYLHHQPSICGEEKGAPRPLDPVIPKKRRM